MSVGRPLPSLWIESALDSVNEMIKTLDGEFQEVDRRSASICSAINGRAYEFRGKVCSGLKEAMTEEESGGTEDRIRKGQLAGLTESLRHVLVKFNRNYVEYQEASRQRALEYSSAEEDQLLDFLGLKRRNSENGQFRRRPECGGRAAPIAEDHQRVPSCSPGGRPPLFHPKMNSRSVNGRRQSHGWSSLSKNLADCSTS